MIASTRRQKHSCHAGGGGEGSSEMPTEEEWRGGEISLLRVSPSSTLLQAVDRTNISGVPTEAPWVPAGGLNRSACREAPERTEDSTGTPII